MNIIYKLTNITKKGFPKYYIGCKTDATITDLNGIPTIINTITNRPYYGSSLNKIFSEDFSNNHIFVAEILEEVSGKENLLQKEAVWLEKFNVKDNEEFYNLTNGFNAVIKSDKVVNIYGEKLKEFSQNQSNISKRRSTVSALGYKTILDFMLFVIKEHIDEKRNLSSISVSLKKERHFLGKFINKFDLSNIKTQSENLSKDLSEKCIELYSKGASVYKISEILNLEIPIVDFYLQEVLKFKDQKSNSFLVAKAKGFTQKEFSNLICKDIALGLSINEVAKKHGLNTQAAYRYVEYFIKNLYSNKTLSSSDT